MDSRTWKPPVALKVLLDCQDGEYKKNEGGSGQTDKSQKAKQRHE